MGRWQYLNNRQNIGSYGEFEFSSVTYIGELAFSLCTSLTSLTISDTVTSIGAEAFNGCTSLASAPIPASVTYIGDSAFYRTPFLNYNADEFMIINNVLLKHTDTGNTAVTIPDNVTSIGSWGFFNCKNLTSVTIPNSVTHIGVSAFNGCASLTSLTIPNSVTSIGHMAFDEYENLTISCSSNSYAYTYCVENEVEFR